MDCPGCGKANRSDARFCKFCGVTLETRCAACGAELDADARFCDACGAPISTPTDRQAPVAAARKVVTVLFADLTGSTALEEKMDAESARALVDRFYAALRKEVEQRAGRVVKFTGDGLMAAFGVPDVHEDDASRAVETAFAMCGACEQLAHEIGNPAIALKVGVNTGEVVVIEDDDDVVGDSVNVAARLEGAAQAGDVLVGEETWRVTRGTVRYEAIPPLELKGKTEPVPAYRVLSIEGTAETTATPFVGREHELGELMAIFDETVASQAARLVTIVGSPGLGKTRLALEFMSRLGERARTRETRCDPAGSATFAPIADALRAGSAIPDDANEATILTALAERIPHDDPDRDRIASLSAAIFGVGQPGSTEETFWALRRMLEIAAAERPAVLVLDDLHWAEPLLLELIEHLSEWIRDAPVMLVCTARPELRDIRPSLVEGGRASSVIALEGLDEDETARLALGLLGTQELPTELLAKIPASTHGNPLFVRELVRMLVDDGVLVRAGDGWSVTVDVEGIEVPPTIQSLLAARVDRLRPDERAVVELASVIGKEFYRGALQELAAPSVQEQIDGCLESLRRKELVEPTGAYWIDEPVYRFHHALIRDACYRRVLKETRAQLHQRVADWLKRKTADVLSEHDELIGYHLEQAHGYLRQLGRSDDALGRRAADLLGQAAQRSLDRDDLPAAAALSGRALDRLPADDPSRTALLLVRCEALLSMGDVAAGRVAVDELERLADSSRLAGWATCFAGQLANLIAPERLQETEKRVSAAAAELAKLGDPAGAAKAHTVHGETLARLGRFADCEAVLDAALTAAREAGDRRRITAVLASAPLAALWGPSPVSRAGGRCLDLVRLSRITTASPAVEATSLRCQAVLEAFRGRADAARRMLRSARRTLEELGLRHELLETDQFSGIVELVDNDAVAAQEHLRAAHEGFLAFGVDVLAAQSAALIARTHLLLGEDEEAERFASESERLGGQDLKASIAWRAVRAELLARRGEVDGARRLAESAIELAAKTDALIDHGDACRALAAVCTAARDHDAARVAHDRAFALYERKGATALIEPPTVSSPAAAPDRSVASEVALENACTRVGAQMIRLFRRRDWEAMTPLVDTDFVHEDRRKGLRDERSGGLPTDLAELGVTRIEGDVVAVRGERLALSHLKFLGEDSRPGVFEAEILLSQELNEAGRLTRQIVFEPEDFGAAVEDLDTRFLAGEGASHADVVEPLRRLTRAFTAADWDAVRDVLAPDVVVRDHRPASLGEIDGSDTWIETARELNRLVPYRSDVIAYHAFAPDAAACLIRYHGQTEEGAVVESAFQFAFQVRDAQIVRMEPFPIDQLDAALARFEELKNPQPSLVNAVSRTWDRVAATFEARDWAAHEALYSPDCAGEDRRPGLGVVISGRTQVIEHMRTLPDIGVVAIERQTIAVRGERLALGCYVFKGAEEKGGYEVPILQVTEADEDGRISGFAVFDSDNLSGAVAELEQRYIAGEGAPFARELEVSARLMTAYNTEDWDALRGLIADDLVLVDHRLASYGEVRGADEFVQFSQVMLSAIRDRRVTIRRIHALGVRRSLGELRIEGMNSEGGAVDLSRLAVGFLDEHDRVTRVEYFPVDQLDAARARFDELVSTTQRSIENDASRAARAMYDAVERGDWDRIHALHSSDCTIEDRRQGLGMRTSGIDEMVAIGQAIASLPGPENIQIRSSTMATRGRRLTLSRVHFSAGSDSFEVDILQLAETDQEGLLRDWVTWETHEPDAAFAELEARYVAGEGAPFAGILDPSAEAVSAWNAQDWDRWSSYFTPDVVFVDHRAVSQNLRGRDEAIARAKHMSDLVPSLRHEVVAVHAVDSDRVLAQWRAYGENTEGGSVELEYHNVATMRDGLIDRIERFGLEQLDAALARFEELEGSRAIDARANEATRRLRYLVDRFERRDWDAVATVLATEAVFEDRRSLLQVRSDGREAVLEMLHALAAVGVATLDVSLLATRGDRLCVGTALFGGARDAPGRFEAECLALQEINADGQVTATLLFDPDDFDGAFAELNERWVTLEGRGVYGALARMTQRLTAAANEGDWAAYDGLLAEDLVAIDHRPVSLGERHGREAEVETMREMSRVIPDLRYYLLGAHAYDHRGSVSEILAKGSTSSGGPVELSFVGVYVLRGEVISHIEIYPVDALDAALARFKELSASGATLLSNAAIRLAERIYRHVEKADAEGVDAFVATDLWMEDRRSGLRWSSRGRDEFVNAVQAFTAAHRIVRHPVAIRGERLMLGRARFESLERKDFGADVLQLFEVDEALASVSALVTFEPGAIEEAFDELDGRWLASGEATEAEGLELEFQHAYNARDWGRMRSLLCDDFVHVDRRPAGWGTVVGGDDYAHRVRASTDLVPDRRIRTIRSIAFGADVALFELWLVGTDQYGGTVEWRQLDVQTLRDGRIGSVERFPIDRLDDAIAHARELADRHPTEALDNAATRLADRLYRHLEDRAGAGLDAVLAPDVWAEDRRPGLRWSGRGRQEFIETSRSIDVDEIRCRWIATRGDRLVLGHATYVHTGRFDVDVLYVVETDARERISAIIAIEPDDLDAAFAELDERYLRALTGPRLTIARWGVEFLTAYNRRDWALLLSLVAPQFVLVDHVPAAVGRIESRDAYVDYLKSMTDLAPDATIRIVRDVALESGAALTETRMTGRSADGMEIELRWLDLATIVDGQVASLEQYPTEQLDDAKMRFEELRARRDLSSTELENAASRARDRFNDSFAARDWVAVAKTLSPRCVGIDRRSGLGVEVVGSDRVVENMQEIAALGVGAIDCRTIAVRGDRLALDQTVYRATDRAGFEVETIGLAELDDRGQLARFVVFGAGDLNTAFAELDERFADGEGAPYAEMIRFGSAGAAAFNARDWDRYAATFAPDVVVVDHQAASAGEIRGRDEALEYVKLITELAPDIREDFIAVHVLDERGGVWEARARGHTTEGATMEFALQYLGVFEGGRLVRFEFFPAERLDAAIARYRELTQT